MKISQLLIELINICTLIMPYLTFIRRRIEYFQINFAYINWLWQFWWREEWTPDSITRLGWEVNITLMQDDESVKICAGSWIKCFKPNWDFITSIFQSSYVVVSCLYQLYDLALTSMNLHLSSRMTIKYGFLLVILSKLGSKLSANFSKTSDDWLGKRYKEIKLHNLPPNNISKFAHSSKHIV